MISIHRDRSDNIQNDILLTGRFWETLPVPADVLQSLDAVFKFQSPTPFQRWILPSVLTTPHCSMVTEADLGSGRTVCCVMALILSVLPAVQKTQAVCFTPTRELALHQTSIAQKLVLHTAPAITVLCTEASGDRSFAVRTNPHVVIGTNSKVNKWINASKVDLSNVTLLAYDEADLMLQKHDVRLQTTTLMSSIKAASCNSGSPLQVLMFGPFLDDPVRAVAQKLLHGCQVKKNYASLSPWPAHMFQWKTEAKRQGDKHGLVQTILQNCDWKQRCVIFVRANETVRQLQKLVVNLGMPCSIARSGMRDSHWDNQTSQFCKGQTQILITTDIMARNSHLMQKVNIIINYNPPVGELGENGMFTTYVHRVCSSSCGRAVFNLWAGQAEKTSITAIEEHFWRGQELITVKEHEELRAAMQLVYR
ncbi:TPA: hypothetical protein ACH3X2_011796 [Trebouxia sp. C0005]